MNLALRPQDRQGHVVGIAVGLMLVALLDIGEILVNPRSEAIGIFDAIGIDVGAVGANENGCVTVRALVIIAVTQYPIYFDIKRTQDFRRAEQDVLSVLITAGEGGDRVGAVLPAGKV